MDKRFIIKPQNLVDFVLRSAHTGFVDDPRAVIFAPDHEIDGAAAASAGARPPPQHSIARAFLLKVNLNAHVSLPKVNQFVVAFGARLPPQRPRHRIQNRRFAGSVLPRQAGKLNALKDNRIWGAVREEVMQFQPCWNHGVIRF